MNLDIKTSKEDLFQVIYKNLDELIIIINSDWKIEFINKSVLKKTLGYPKEDLIGYKINKLFHPEERIELTEKIKSLINNKKVNLEGRIKDKNGKWHWFSIYGERISYTNIFTKAVFILKDITQNKNKLKEADEKYLLLTENINDLVALTNDKFKFEYINEEVTSKLMGYKPKDLIGKSVLEFVHPEDLEYAKSELIKRFDEGEGSAIIRYRHKDGHWEWLEVRAKKFNDTYNNTKVLFVSRIVSDRIEYQKKLEKSEQRYRLITENANDLISMFNDKLKFTYINKKTHQRILGYKKEDLIGKRLWKFIHPEDFQRAYKIIKNRLKKGLGRAEIRFKKKNGTYIWLETVGVAFLTKDNKRLGVTISRDISERKKYERLLKKQIRDRIEYQKELEKSEEKYRLITENANDLIGVFDEKLRITYINEKAHKRILGYTKEDMIGKPLWNFIHPDEFEDVFNKIKNEWENGTGRAILRFKKKDGSYIWIETIAEAFKTKDNRLLGLTISRDVSERKKFEELIKEENKKLKKLNKMRKNLINRVSHELKTPMTSVFGSIQLIEEICKQKLDNEGLEMIAIAKRGCKRLQNLIENILDVSIIDASELKIKKEKVNFGKIVKNCIKELKYLIEKKQLLVEINMIDDIEVFVDKLRIEEVIINLISNSIKNTPRKGKISISLEESNNKAKFIIKDNGIGIEKEEKEALFTKFGKIERKNYQEDINMEGSGLGLYISKKIIEGHNGKIWAESDGRNKGSSFYFTLPIL
jgi:PAS domain S-box-containing protein